MVNGDLNEVCIKIDKFPSGKIKGFPTLNEYIKAINSNRFVGNSMKHTYTDVAYAHGVSKPSYRGKIKKPAVVAFEWHYTGRHDLDNIAFAKKFILDGLQKAGVIANDNQKCIVGFQDKFIKDSTDYVNVTIKEVE